MYPPASTPNVLSPDQSDVTMDPTIILALQVYGLAAVISFAVAGLMKLLYVFVSKQEGDTE
jgi:hypothetical protein